MTDSAAPSSSTLPDDEPNGVVVSVVIPMHNEAGNVAALIDELTAVLDTLSVSSEIIVVDDGSTDETALRLKETFRREQRLRVIEFSQNEGQTAALREGVRSSRGSVVVTLDGDRQNDPADVPSLIGKLDEGYDLVVGWRQSRRDGFWAKRLPSLVGNKVIRWLTGSPVHDTGCTLKAFRASTARALPLISGFHRFIPALVVMQGGAVTELAVHHRPRLAGASKYGWGRLGRVGWDLAQVATLRTFLPCRSRASRLKRYWPLVLVIAGFVMVVAPQITTDLCSLVWTLEEPNRLSQRSQNVGFALIAFGIGLACWVAWTAQVFWRGGHTPSPEMQEWNR